MQKITVIVLITSIVLSVSYCYAQQMPGQPHISSHQPMEYPQNWDFAQDSSGIMYVANQGGVVEYDGVRWIPYNTIDRSVYSLTFDNQGNLHVGAEGELGYFKFPKPDTSLIPEYVSLVDSIPPEYREVGNVWQTEEKGDWTYYNNLRYIFAFDGKKIKVLQSSSRFSFMHLVHNVLYVQVANEGIFRIEGGQLVRDDFLSEYFAGEEISLMLPASNGGMLVYTNSKKFFTVHERDITPFARQSTDFFQTVRIYRGHRLSDGSYIFGTLDQGLFRLSENGDVISTLNKKVGLPDDMVLNLFQSSDGLVWAALNDGVATIEYHSPIRRANNVNNIDGMIRDIARLEHDLFIATTNGLYKTSLKKRIYNTGRQFTNIANANGNISIVQPVTKNTILYATRDSLYTYSMKDGQDYNAKIGTLAGINSLVQDGEKLIFYAGTTDGIYRLNVNPTFNNVISSRLIELRSAVTNMVLHKGSLWAGTLLDGPKKIDLTNSSVTSYNIPHRDMTESVRVAKIRDSVYIASNSGLHTINGNNKVAHSTIFGDFSADSTRQFFLIKEDDWGNVWMRSNGAHQVAHIMDDGTYSIEKKWLSRITDRQINVIYPDPYESGLVWLGGAKGLVSYHTEKDNLDDEVEKFSSIIRSVKINGDSVAANEHSEPKVFKYQHRNLRFNYAATHFQKPTLTQYQVLLEGFDNAWSTWTNETQKDYTNITEGVYTFKVRAKDLFGRVTQTAGYTFTIKPPWFRTWWAYSLYVLIIAGIAYGAHMWRVKRLLHIYKLRNDIARDLHDEVSATLSSISFFASAAKMDNTQEDNKKYINLIEQSSNDAKEKINDIIWSVDPEKDSWSLFVAKCRRYAADLLESREIEHDIQMVSECDISLDLRLRQNLWLIYKEIVTNAARHSGADNVKISCQTKGKKLMLSINDNGRGIEDPDSQLGNGIKNIYKRADEIGAKVTLNTNSKKGTQWKVEITQ